MKQLSDVADLINDASDVMRFEQGAVLQTVPVPLPLKVIGRSAVDHVKDLAKPRVRVAFEFEKGPSVASLDAKRLHRALDQLLKNAAEATPEGGSITLKVRRVWDARARERERERGRSQAQSCPSLVPPLFLLVRLCAQYNIRRPMLALFAPSFCPHHPHR